MTSLLAEAAPQPTRSSGPGEQTFPQFLADFRAGRAPSIRMTGGRTLDSVPPVRRP
jgi:hypothetical protein